VSFFFKKNAKHDSGRYFLVSGGGPDPASVLIVSNGPPTNNCSGSLILQTKLMAFRNEFLLLASDVHPNDINQNATRAQFTE
jgi:hypothetical protein